MEKISRILPSNSQLNKAHEWRDSELSLSAPALRTGRNMLHSSKELALKAHRELTGWRAKEARHSEIAEKVQSGFFSKPEPAIPEERFVEAPQVYTEDFLQGPVSWGVSHQPLASHPPSFDEEIDNYIGEVLREAEAFKAQSVDVPPEEDLSYYPKGSFISFEV